MAFNLLTLVRPNIAQLQPYRCARDDFKEGILLDANENTHGPALHELSDWEQALKMNRYPDPHQITLKQQIVDFRNTEPSRFFDGFKLAPKNLCLGVGSDESIDLLLRCACVPGTDKLLVCPPTYGMYSICAKVNDVSLVSVPLLVPDFQLNVPKIIEAVVADPAIKLIYVTSPGNPTGKLLSPVEIVALLKTAAEKWNGLVVVDEAYIDFCSSEDSFSQSVSTLVNQHANLVVFQTLSKSFGLAGIRLGVTYASAQLSGYLNAMKYPYNISSLTSAVATRSTDASGLAVMKKYVDLIVEQRLYVLHELQKLDGVGRNLGGLDANFVLLEMLDKEGRPSNEVAKAVYNNLAVHNAVVVRFRGNELNCTGALRISIGRAGENEVMIARLAKCLEATRA
ncbi:histidinol-phosphate aminotransferase [Metschnikowia bicuspidata]|uniref:histidinol-phosphate transaminase n=1 Tax=Metschnikowia bicuspidata TaxID=27322 RepID=A0A4P9ZIG1_9ASCO|nr:histidinol-phosphate aminotransferase [Metschnikowia bicuspidata]